MVVDGTRDGTGDRAEVEAETEEKKAPAAGGGGGGDSMEDGSIEEVEEISGILTANHASVDR